MSVVFTLIFVLEVSVFSACASAPAQTFIVLSDVNKCGFLGDDEADSHVTSRLLAEPTESL